jgi:hypothetical protein
MAVPTNDNAQLLIRCPSCGQRFKVGMDLRDRTVECGACEHRFRINDSVIVRSKKFYPGERVDSLANRYHRVPIAAPMPEGLQTVHYADVADASAFEPISPQRLVAGAGALVLVVLMALLLFFGARNGGALDGMPTVNRLLMAGFTAIVAGALLIYANPKTRGKAVMTSLVCALVLLALPVFRTEGTGLLPASPGPDDRAAAGGSTVKNRSPQQPSEDDPIAELRATIGTDPLVEEAAKQAEKGGGRHAYGLWLRGLGGGEKLLVRDYLIRKLAADPTSTHAFPRPPYGYLMVVAGLSITLDQLAAAVAPIGDVTVIHPEIDVIEVKVKSENFQAAPVEELADREKPAFYQLNKRELESIDLDRVKGAVERLTDAEPTLYRADIARRLVELLKEDGIDFKAQVCDALLRWGVGSDEESTAAEALLMRLNKANATIPAELIALLVKAKRESIIPILERLWLEDVSKWERYLVDLGPPIEPTLIARFPELAGNFKASAVHVLGKVGGRDSLKLMETARQGANQELLVRIETAEKAIHERLGE